MYKISYCLKTLCCLLFFSIAAMRTSNHPIEKIFLTRHSACQYSKSKISQKELNSLFEAARWAPSSFNNQPTKFVYTTSDSSSWPKFFNLLNPYNRSWAKNCSALILVLSDQKICKFKNSCKQSFDAGAAVQNLALQASAMGLSAHVIEGFDYNAARSSFNIPNRYNIEVMVAIGQPEKNAKLNPRKKIEEIAFFENMPT